jgi:hypothetical protein
MLRKIASGADDIGDTTSLSNPEIIADIVRGHKNIAQGRAEEAPEEKDRKRN